MEYLLVLHALDFYFYLFCRGKNVVSGAPRNYVRGGEVGSTNSVEDRENGDLGAVAP